MNKKSVFVSIFAFAAVMLYGLLSYAADPAAANLDIIATIKSIVAGFKGGAYREGVASVVVLIVYSWRRWASGFVLSKVTNKWWLSFIPLLLGLVGSVPAALLADPFSWKDFILQGFVTGAEAMAMWSFLVKPVLDKLGLSGALKEAEANAGSTWKQ